jgi:hypothetical protein
MTNMVIAQNYDAISIKFNKESAVLLKCYCVLFVHTILKDGILIIANYLYFFQREYNDSELLGFWTFPSSGILETRKHVSDTGSLSVLR